MKTYPATDISRNKLLARMNDVVCDPEHPLMAAAVGVVKDGQVLFSEMVGRKQLDGEAANSDTKYRIASVSKLITAIGIWQLIEKGLLDPDADVSEYIGFKLRNPNHPNTAITVRMLMTHTSSIRDGEKPGSYNIPYGYPLSAFFTEGNPHYVSECWGPATEAPGVYFKYCNMNYCLLGSVIENISGERFDRYMIDHIFSPMGLTCSYNIPEMPAAVQRQVGTLYHKLNDAGKFDPKNGHWVAQCDDFSNGYPTEIYDDYVIGTNGSLYGPMGSLRVSVNELCRLTLLFCNGGSYQGHQILKAETIERMFTPVWVYDPALKNGDNYLNMCRCYGMGPHIFTNTKMGDRIVENQVLPFAGHNGDAYGVLSGMVFDRKRGNGLIYIIAGLGCDPEQYYGKYSTFQGWEEDLFTAAADFAQFDY